MMDHETFLLLAAKQISEALPAAEESELERHLATCPSCRSVAAAMRRDDILLRGQLGVATVSPRVRRRVLDDAAGVRRFDWRVLVALAATLLLATIAVPLIAGGRLAASPPAPPVATAESPTPASSVVPSSVVPSPSTASIPPSASPEPARFVAGAYTYGEPVTRRDAVSAHFDQGAPAGEWSRTIPATSAGDSFGGPITCLVISGSDAWLAGPATTATDGSTGRAAYLHLHDGGPNGSGDAAILWLSNAGETLTTMEGWCESRFIPGGPFPLTSGDIVVQDGSG
jgi:putative zinc finger protein